MSGLRKSPSESNLEHTSRTFLEEGGNGGTPKPTATTGNRKKRKAEESPTTAEANNGESYAALLSKIRELASLVTKNTTVPIKEAIDDLLKRAARLEEQEKQAANGPQAAAPVTPKVDASTQTIAVEELKEECRAKDLQRRMQEAITVQDAEDILKEDWPTSTYRSTTMEQRSVLAEDPVLAVLVREDSSEDDKLLQELVARFPAVAQLSAPGGLEVGEVAAVATQARVSIRGRKAPDCQEPQVLVFGKVRGPGSAAESIQTAERVIAEIVEAHKGLNAPPIIKVAFHFPMSWDQTMLRKAVEYHHANNSIKALICLRGRMEEQYGTRGEAATRDSRTVQVTVRGGAYADMLKKLKVATDPGQLGCLVKGYAKTLNGELRLQIKELKPGGSRSLVEHIGANTQLEAEAKRGGPDVSYLIRDLDETSTVEEIRRALAVPLKGGESEIKVGEPRRSSGDRWSATVRLPKYRAANLKTLNRIKVGWLTCRITETMGPQFCFNCLKTDHKARDCRRPRVDGGLCFRCGKAGHAARDCTAPEKCFSCETEGHIANTMGCPTYRRHIEAMRSTKAPPAANEPQAAKGPAPRGKRVSRRQQRRAQEVQEFDVEEGLPEITPAAEAVPTPAEQGAAHANRDHQVNDDEGDTMQH